LSSAVRVLAAFLIAPLVPGIVLALITGAPTDLFAVAIAFAPYTYLATLVVGVPAFLAYRRFHFVRLAHYLIGGFVGPIVFFLLVGAVDDYTPLEQWLGTGAWFAVLTCPATALFWVIAVWQPERRG
jgi:hypothetical protein